MTRFIRPSVICLSYLLSCAVLGAQEAKPPSVEDTQEAGGSSAEPPARRLVKWNEYEGSLFTLRASAGVIVDAGAFAQDDASREQFGSLGSDWQVRDFRVMLNGRIKTKRAITWCAGLMYDAANDQWLARQTGVQIAIPELKGQVFVGRSKEGVSLNMIMVGYSGWTMERSTTVVATVPLLADGIKWMGYFPKQRLLYNLGWYTDVLSEGQSFSSYDQQFVARVGFLPILQEKGTLLHVALAAATGS